MTAPGQVKVKFVPINSTSILQHCDEAIIHTAEMQVTWLVRKMLANISMGCDENVNILEAQHIFLTAWKDLSIIVVSDCWHNTHILSVRDEIVEENLTDDDNKDNWQQICQKINMPAEVMMEDSFDVDSDVAIIQEATDDDIMNSIIEEKRKNSGNEEMHNSCNFLEAIHMVRMLQCCLKMGKDVPDHILLHNDTIHDFLVKSLLKQTFEKKITTLKGKIVFVLFYKTQFCKNIKSSN
jgi:hypothetical protein